MVVKVKDAQTKRNKASVAHTGWNKRTKTSTTTPKKVCLYWISLQLLFNRKFANQRAIVQQENQIHRVTGQVVWRKEGWWGALLQSFSPLSLVLIIILFPCLFRRLQHTVDFFVAGSSLLSASLSAFTFLQLQKQLQATQIQTGFFWCCRMRYTCFVSALF